MSFLREHGIEDCEPVKRGRMSALRYDLYAVSEGDSVSGEETGQDLHLGVKVESEGSMTSDKELVRKIYTLMKEADSKLEEAETLMRERKRDIEIEDCTRLKGHAGWSRFRTQLKGYVEQYGLRYLEMEDSE